MKSSDVYYELADKTLVNIHLMDTGGIEKYKQINDKYYKIADCFLIVFDITDRKSYEDSTNFFISKIEENCKKKYKILLVGNKMDLNPYRKIIYEKASIFAKDHHYYYTETSAATNDNVFNAFQMLVDATHMKLDDNDNSKNKEEATEKKKLKYNEDFENKQFMFPKIMNFLNN